ncbi:MAG: serine/threonine protein kinase [Candidatus Riflebacteria bacterium]|nr:serine/threonine protein kinase [Candidatus Riflebacteria bacterium]
MATDSPFPEDCALEFTAIRALASGSFGATYLASQVELGRHVVVKLLHESALADADNVGRFLDEARITASINHPGVVKVIDYGAGCGVPWIAYEYLPGRSLADRVEAGSVPWEEGVEVGVQVAEALEAAHRLGVLHRDVKPANILEVNERQYKLADFGLAKWQGSGVQTETGVWVGTAAYVAPEYLQGGLPTPGLDIYALGGTLFRLLTGRLPFDSPVVAEVLRMHLSAIAPLVTDVATTMPREIDPIVARALAKDPAQRYRHAGEMAAHLRRARDLVAARKLGPLWAPARQKPASGDPRPRPARRRGPTSRLMAALVAALALTGLAATVVLCLLFRRPAAVAPSPSPVASATASPTSAIRVSSRPDIPAAGWFLPRGVMAAVDRLRLSRQGLEGEFGASRRLEGELALLNLGSQPSSRLLQLAEAHCRNFDSLVACAEGASAVGGAWLEVLNWGLDTIYRLHWTDRAVRKGGFVDVTLTRMERRLTEGDDPVRVVAVSLLKASARFVRELGPVALKREARLLIDSSDALGRLTRHDRQRPLAVYGQQRLLRRAVGKTQLVVPPEDQVARDLALEARERSLTIGDEFATDPASRTRDAFPELPLLFLRNCLDLCEDPRTRRELKVRAVTQAARLQALVSYGRLDGKALRVELGRLVRLEATARQLHVQLDYRQLRSRLLGAAQR